MLLAIKENAQKHRPQSVSRQFLTLTDSFLMVPAFDDVPDTSSSRMPSHLRAGLAQERSWLIPLTTISLYRGVLNT